MPANVLQMFPSFQPGERLVDGGEVQQLAALGQSAVSGIVAHAGGGQALATPLTAYINEVATVANENDSVQLPQGIPGRSVLVINSTAATSMQVFGVVSNPSNGNAGDTIAAHNSASQTVTGTGVAQAGATIAMYVCFALGQWKQFLTA